MTEEEIKNHLFNGSYLLLVGAEDLCSNGKTDPIYRIFFLNKEDQHMYFQLLGNQRVSYKSAFNVVSFARVLRDNKYLRIFYSES